MGCGWLVVERDGTARMRKRRLEAANPLQQPAEQQKGGPVGVVARNGRFQRRDRRRAPAATQLQPGQLDRKRAIARLAFGELGRRSERRIELVGGDD